MNGALSLVQTLVNGGIEVTFTNPGTTEIHFVAAVDKVKGMRAVLGLFEGVCTGAADGFARMAGKPAATLLHLGPGLANGLANLHNARRAGSPIVNIIGDHATHHRKYDAPLTSDIESLAKTVSGWVHSSKNAHCVPADGAAAIAASMKPPGQIATLILPADCAWNKGANPAPAPPLPKRRAVDQKTVKDVARILRRGEPTVILIGGPALMAPGLTLASRISRATGARIMGNRVNARLQRGAGRPVIERLPYPVEPALKMLQGTAHLILAGTRLPVSFFAYPDMPGLLVPEDCGVYTLATEEEDIVGALEALVHELKASQETGPLYPFKRPLLPTGKIDPAKVWASLTALMPEHAIISDEAITSGRSSEEWTLGAPPHDWLNITGGAIGQGMPVAIGAAVACPDRKVFSMQADGSAMYTLQALWTQARESLDIITVLFSNRSYAILQGELKKLGGNNPGSKVLEMFDLGNPELDWVKLAQGMGVQASRAETSESLNQQLRSAIQSSGPHLIEVVL